MSTTTYMDPALAGTTTQRDARALVGQVMGFVAVAAGFAALGADLGRDLSGATGLLLSIAAFAAIFGLNFAAAKDREQLATALLFGLGFLLGLAVAPVIAGYANADRPRYGRRPVPPRRSSPPSARTATPHAGTSRRCSARCSGRCWD